MAVPPETPLTCPLEFTVAIDVLFDDQIPPAEVELKRTEALEQIFWIPLNVPATGGEETVIFLVATSLGQIPMPGTV